MAALCHRDSPVRMADPPRECTQALRSSPALRSMWLSSSTHPCPLTSCVSAAPPELHRIQQPGAARSMRPLAAPPPELLARRPERRRLLKTLVRPSSTKPSLRRRPPHTLRDANGTPPPTEAAARAGGETTSDVLLRSSKSRARSRRRRGRSSGGSRERSQRGTSGAAEHRRPQLVAHDNAGADLSPFPAADDILGRGGLTFAVQTRRLSRPRPAAWRRPRIMRPLAAQPPELLAQRPQTAASAATAS